MFNLKQFFNKSEPVALSVSPYLRFLSVGKEVKVIIDSGEEDINQKVAQTRLTEEQSSSINRIFITGFDTIYHNMAGTPAALDANITQVVEPVSENLTKKKIEPTKPLVSAEESPSVSAEPKPADSLDKASTTVSNISDSPTNNNSLSLDVIKAHLSQGAADSADTTIDPQIKSGIDDAFEHEEGVIFGQVCLELNNKEVFVLASPIYIVVPSEVDGELDFVSVDDAKAYISEEWRKEFAVALVSMSSDSVEEPAGHAPSHRSSSRKNSSGNTPLKVLAGSVAVGVLALVTYAVAMPFTNETGSSNAAPVPFSSLTAMSGAQSAKAERDPYALSTTGMPSAEQYAQMQTAATKDILKNMNVDLDASADLGCLSQ